jgi:hypothetical protein
VRQTMVGTDMYQWLSFSLFYFHRVSSRHPEGQGWSRLVLTGSRTSAR